jgi:hypothetical protein
MNMPATVICNESNTPNQVRNAGHKEAIIAGEAKQTCSWGWTKTLGLQFTVVRTHFTRAQSVEKEYTDFSFHISTELPFLGYAFQVECYLRSLFPLCRSVSFLDGGAMISRIIADDSEYLQACRRGDLSLVTELFRIGNARPDDTSKRNMTPLLVRHKNLVIINRCLTSQQCAAESGNNDVVQFLLDHGAAVNWTAGSKQTYVMDPPK